LGIGIREDALWINWLENFVRILTGTGDLGKLQERWMTETSWMKELP
jgi:hypothetical protein